ncbi:MAG: alpha/beta fold hydrolase [Chloroflexi bacterium]|nr:alpha/beta fold hydrolase [Chloroflexota bacterium]
MPKLSIFVLGSPRIEYEKIPIKIDRRKAVALLVYLVVTNRGHTRDALATLLWPTLDQSKARGALRRTLSVLNKALNGEWLDINRETVTLEQNADVWLDVNEFHELLAFTDTHDHPDDEICSKCLSSKTTAVELYRDDFLVGFTLKDSPKFDEWQFFLGENFRLELASALERIVSVTGEQKKFELAIHNARRWVALDPIQENAHRQLMNLFAASGQRNAALRQYHECARIIKDELGVNPQKETVELLETIKRGQKPPSLTKKISIPQTRYVRSGEIYIAYQVVGSGPIDFLVIPGYVTHLEHAWNEPKLANILQRLASISRLILFDKRGTGLSDRAAEPPKIEQTMNDAMEVLKAVGSKQAALYGYSEGGPMSALFAATHPERTLGLILYGTFAKGTRVPDYPWALNSEQHKRWIEEIEQNWGSPLLIDFFAPSAADDNRFRKWWAKFLRLGASPGAAVDLAQMMAEIDIRDTLPSIRVPTLVLHRTDDKLLRVEGGRFIAGQIPGAKYVELPGVDHLWWTGNTEEIVSEIEDFLTSVQQTDT